MSQKKNIDELFRESISGYTVQPSEKVWKNIDSQYPYAGRSNRWIIYSVAALLLLSLGFSGWYFYSTDAEHPVELEQQLSTGRSSGSLAGEDNSLTMDNTVQAGEEKQLPATNQSSNEEGLAETNKTDRQQGFFNEIQGCAHR